MRAYELCVRDGESIDLLRALAGIRIMHLTIGNLRKAHELSREILEIARRINDPIQLAIAHTAFASGLTARGEMIQARQMIEESIDMIRSLSDVPELHVSRSSLHCVLSRTLWQLGFADQAHKQAREAETAGHRSSNPLAKAFGLQPQEVDIWCDNFESVRENSQTLLEAPWATELNQIWIARANLIRGWLMARQGQTDGVPIIRDAMATVASSRFGINRSLYGAMLAEACASVGRFEEALSAVDEVLPFAETEELYYEAELNRLPRRISADARDYRARSRRKMFPHCDRHRKEARSQIVATARDHQSRPLASRHQPPRRSPHDAHGNLQLVHRGLRNSRPQRREGTPRRTGQLVGP